MNVSLFGVLWLAVGFIMGYIVACCGQLSIENTARNSGVIKLMGEMYEVKKMQVKGGDEQ